jgi:hypothetical protein
MRHAAKAIPSSPKRSDKTQTGRTDRYPSDYGRRDEEDSEAPEKSDGSPNIDEQGERANIRQNTPPKELPNKR